MDQGEKEASVKLEVTTTKLERRFQIWLGILIGLCLGLILLGLLDWLSANYDYAALNHYFSYGGLSENFYLFDNLTDQIATSLMFILVGGTGLIWAALMYTHRSAWQFLFSKGPNTRWGSGLMGGGAAVAWASTRLLFLYLLAPYYMEFGAPSLELFFIPFIVGIFLFALGILILKRALKTPKS